MVTSKLATTLIVARQSPLQNGLRALLNAMPQVGVVHEADDLSAATQAKLEPQPVLVLLDGDAAGEIGLSVRRMRLRWPQARCVCLANDVQQEKKASEAGADAVLLKGAPAARLIAVLVRLLGRSRQQDESSAAGVSVRPRQGWLPRLGGQVDHMLRNRGWRSDRRGRAARAREAVGR
jgi:DNA-binding NarL/FixJ family response regulator